MTNPTLRHRDLAGKRVLVTGATGFLGAHLVRRLAQSGAVVMGVSRRPQPDRPDLTWYGADLSQRAAVDALLATTRPDLVFHLAGAVTAAPDIDHVGPTFESLLASTVHLLGAATARRCERVVLVGTLLQAAVQGDVAIPGSPYVAAKWAAAAYGRMFHALYGAPVVMPRLAIAYGPGQHPRRVIPYVMLSLLRGAAPRLGSGGLRADWIYVDDAVEGLVAAATVDGLEGTSPDLGTGTLVSVREVVERIVTLAGVAQKPVFGTEPDRPLEAYEAADIAATATRLGWRARTSLDAGLRLTYAWWRAHAGTAGAAQPS